MDELYVQHFSLTDGAYRSLGPSTLVRPETLPLAPTSGGLLLAGNVFSVYAGRLPALPEGSAALTLLPTAAAMLRLAPALLAAGQARPADQALPLYVRDKVALTTDERAQAKLAALPVAAA
jgi:tRNA threonylcarbamoyladenosine biosynthesis protein TsaB